MNILFVSSGNSENHKITPFIKKQGDSLNTVKGVTVTYFPILGGGIKGYFKNARLIKEYVDNNDIDIIHAHYVLCGWSAVLACTKKPIVLSLMGSDAYGIYIGEKRKFFSRYLTLLTYLIQPFVDAIISKSQNIDSYVYIKNKSNIIPNGIDVELLEQFKDVTKQDLGLDPETSYILFLGDKNDPRKNYSLVHNAVNKIKDPKVRLIAPYPITHEEVFKYLSVTDVFVMSSFMEGSPNVVKEAMSCNCPMVVTDVGDVSWIVEGVDGCYISSFEIDDFVQNLKKAIDYRLKHGKTKGLLKINLLGIDTNSIANKIISIYKKVI